ncbi:MAG: hypothetical protein QM638_19240 [Nocardioides sp.]|uniref:hypothetical protein n=1 Tax=Nocardioides sp. TaxID=35761 RepID=UPI0039E52D67
MDAVTALTRLGGISPAGRIVALSSRKRLATAVRRGQIVKLSRNRYCLPVTEHGLGYARELAGHLSHLSAALHHGWEVCFPPEKPQLIVPSAVEVPAGIAWAVESTRSDLRPKDTDGWATSRLHTVLLCARDLPPRDALAVADSALRHGDLTATGLLDAAHAWRGAGRDRILAMARLADARAANPFESALRMLAIESGLDVVPQWEVRSSGLVLHPDLADPIRGIALEADSWTHHGAQSADHDRDCERYNALVVAGWIVLRFTWTQVMLAPHEVRATLAAVLDAMERGDIRVT